MTRPKFEDYVGYALDNYELNIRTEGKYGFTRRQCLAEIMANHNGQPNFHTAEGGTRIRALEDPDELKNLRVIDWLLSDDDESWEDENE